MQNAVFLVCFVVLSAAQPASQGQWASAPVPQIVYGFQGATGVTATNIPNDVLTDNYDGTLVQNSRGSPRVGSDGKFGNCLHFGPGGTSPGYLQLPDNVFFLVSNAVSTDYTFSAWIRPAGNLQLDTLLRVGNAPSSCDNDVAFALNVTHARNIFLQSPPQAALADKACYGPSFFASSLGGNTGEWIPVAVAFDSEDNTLSIYAPRGAGGISGNVAQWDIVSKGNGTDGTQYGSVGGSPFSPEFLGSIDDFRIYNQFVDPLTMGWLMNYPYVGDLPNVTVAPTPIPQTLPVGSVNLKDIGLHAPIASSGDVSISGSLYLELNHNAQNSNDILMVHAQGNVNIGSATLFVDDISVPNDSSQAPLFAVISSVNGVITGTFSRLEGRDGNGDCVKLTGSVSTPSDGSSGAQYIIEVGNYVPCFAATIFPSALAITMALLLIALF